MWALLNDAKAKRWFGSEDCELTSPSDHRGDGLSRISDAALRPESIQGVGNKDADAKSDKTAVRASNMVLPTNGPK